MGKTFASSTRRKACLRVLLLAGLYSIVSGGALWLAFQLRFDFQVPANHQEQFAAWWSLVVAIKLLALLFFKQFSGLLRFFSLPDLSRLLYASAFSSVALLLPQYLLGAGLAPRGVILLDFIFSCVGWVLVRLGFRILRDHRPVFHVSPVRKVGIIGAGDAGAALARELSRKKRLGLIPVAFFDDDRAKWNSHVHNLPVLGAPELLSDSHFRPDLTDIIIAMPSAPAKRIGEVVHLLRGAARKFATVPSLDQLATGKLQVTQLRSVEIQDLLGREPIHLQAENIQKLIKGRTVMVTGAGGSIGSELCRQIISFDPESLLLVEQAEVQLFPIEQELLNGPAPKVNVVPLIADILDRPRMLQIFQEFQPDIIFHAAAHKHVPMMEMQPGEAVKNNVFGTAQLANLALEFGVERFVLISSDKAVNPTNVMGATKRVAEIYMQSLFAMQPNTTRFMAVRFGNVLGSSGSVVQTFKKQIAAGGPVTVTHPEVTRFFMTIPEAAGLVLQSATQGRGGEIFVLDMGKPVKIVDLANELIQLSGFRPGEDIEVKITGLRPGEKLYEELCFKGEDIVPTENPKIMRFVNEPQSMESLRGRLDILKEALHAMSREEIKLFLQGIVPEYQPFLEDGARKRGVQNEGKAGSAEPSRVPALECVPVMERTVTAGVLT